MVSSDEYLVQIRMDSSYRSRVPNALWAEEFDSRVNRP